MDEKYRPPSLHHLVAGCLGGGASVVALYPLDLVKTRFQVQSALLDKANKVKVDHSTFRKPYRSFGDAFVSVIRNSGIRGLYQGMSMNLLGSSLSWGSYFWLYNIAKDTAIQYKQSTDPEFKKIENPTLSPFWHVSCAMGTGAVVAVATNPIWVLKTRFQIQEVRADGSYRSLREASRDLWYKEGVRGLFRGLVPALIGTSHGAIQFMTYEEILKVMRRRKSNAQTNSQREDLGVFQVAFAGLASKTFAVATTYPYQVVRSRLQMRYTQASENIKSTTPRIRDILQSIWRTDGVKGFYRGMSINIIRVAPSAGITFVVYEQCIKFFRSLSSPNR